MDYATISIRNVSTYQSIWIQCKQNYFRIIRSEITSILSSWFFKSIFIILWRLLLAHVCVALRIAFIELIVKAYHFSAPRRNSIAPF